MKDTNYTLYADPLFHFETGQDRSASRRVYTNTRGVQVGGTLGNNVAFYSSFYESQGTFVDYMDQYIQQSRVVPGQGEPKTFKGNRSEYDYNMAEAYVNYKAKQFFNFTLGYGKNFIGNGYRSLLLSDNTFNYPYFKITTDVWRIRYTNIYTQFQDIYNHTANTVQGKGYPKKYGSFHYLSLNVSKSLNIGLFESVIWQGSDSSHYRTYDFTYLNPVIFYRSAEYGMGSPDNSLIGLNLLYKVTNTWSFYGQFILDDFKFAEYKKGNEKYRQKYGFQFGTKVYDLFAIKNLHFLAEYNYVMPFTYSHRWPRQNYSHYNQALAHPLGANFKEWVGIINYRIGRLVTEFKYINANYGENSATVNYGRDIFIPEHVNFQYSRHAGQGIPVNLNFAQVKLGYIINPATNMKVELTYLHRMLNQQGMSKHLTQYIGLAFKTDLRNFYNDF
ncbi:MAG: hypothetical protein ACK40G_03065 [Cytophagaceae bacterium]